MFLCQDNNSTGQFASVSFVDPAQRLSDLIDDPEIEGVDDLCFILDISHARLIRLCRRQFGYAPKFLLRRARFNRMLAELRVRPYAQWRSFLDPRYVDQSHFIRDCHYFLGMAPTRFLSLPLEAQDACATHLTTRPVMAMAA